MKGCPMDAYELMALNLETAQTKRYRLYRKKIDFWNEMEVFIFNEIKGMRAKSSTYNPNNTR